MDDHRPVDGWQFLDDAGTFELNQPHRTSYLYFPLVNEAGLMSVITPTLHGDSKTDQNHFLTAPVSVEDLHNSRAARNFWVQVEGKGAWSATGNSAAQIAQRFTENDEPVHLRAGFLWHTLTREAPLLGLRAEITNFVPPGDDQVELMKVTLTNITDHALTITPVAAIPVYGRSADSLRDHRHVTSLLHRISLDAYGVLVCPTLSFDERGHNINTVTYAALGAEEDGAAPQDFCPLVEEFIGEGGSLDWPEFVVKPTTIGYAAPHAWAGYEAIGALRFKTIQLRPGQSKAYVIVMAVIREGETVDHLVKTYGSQARFEDWFKRNGDHWQAQLATLKFSTADPQHNRWLKWVAVQPILRRLYGNSFLPYHDYGRGGRGWRDLWQDCLALLLMEPDRVGNLLLANYAGVRIDGSNATIIGSQPGQFIADRNNIPRIWMDHGAWPFLTTRLYIDQSGDLKFLLKEQTYFKDQHIDRARGTDREWQADQGTRLRTSSGAIYSGTLLEHILVQHLTPFFNAGAHHNIKLEDADWNDGMDMASERGESVAFTAFYASNLRDLSQLVLELEKQGVASIELASEMMLLLDSLSEPVNYDVVADKQQRLQNYFAACRHTLSGQKTPVTLRDLSKDLAAKADWLFNHLRQSEWLRNSEGYEWFNGYYDNDGERVEGDHPNGVRMTLTGQVFTLMGGIANNEQARHIVRSVQRYLVDPRVGGPRLNTDFGEVKHNLGRCFGFAFGTKENGAMFSHMTVMYAKALYQRGLVREGYQILEGIYRHCRSFATSRIYPGIPEYIDAKGRGAYPYLTGSASWLLLTMLTEAFGVKGRLGDLVFEPRLVREQFDAAGIATVATLFADRQLEVVYHNPARLDYADYGLESIRIDAVPVEFKTDNRSGIIARRVIEALNPQQRHRIDVMLI